jgi:hypothetical protein
VRYTLYALLNSIDSPRLESGPSHFALRVTLFASTAAQSRRASRSASKARFRWEMAFFSSSLISP